MENLAYVLGFLVGLLCVVIVSFIIRIIWKKKHGTKYGTYDERQVLARGSAYKSGFLILMVYELFVGMLSLGIGKEFFADSMTRSFVGIVIAVSVFAVECIVKDAYCSLSENAKSLIVLFLAAGIINLMLVIRSYFIGESYLTNGKLNYHSMNLMVAIMAFVIAMANLIKMHQDKLQAGE